MLQFCLLQVQLVCRMVTMIMASLASISIARGSQLLTADHNLSWLCWLRAGS
jgi:hypothetical protein